MIKSSVTCLSQEVSVKTLITWRTLIYIFPFSSVSGLFLCKLPWLILLSLLKWMFLCFFQNSLSVRWTKLLRCDGWFYGNWSIYSIILKTFIILKLYYFKIPLFFFFLFQIFYKIGMAGFFFVFEFLSCYPKLISSNCRVWFFFCILQNKSAFC